MRTSSFSGTRLGGWYFVGQAVLIGLWWGWLWRDPVAVELFRPPGAGTVDLLAFRLPDLLVAAPASAAAGVAILAGSRWAVALAWLAAGALDYAFFVCLGWSWLRDGAWWNVLLMAPAALLSTIFAFDTSGGSVKVFRPATRSTPARHLLMTLGQTALFWLAFLGVAPFALTALEGRLGLPSFEVPGQLVAAGVLFVAFSALGLASGVTMAGRGQGTPLPLATANDLVSSGPYAYLRNPMVVAGLGQGLAVGLGLGSWLVVAYSLAGGVLWQVLVRPAEERDLAQRFGGGYAEYCRRVRCWVPGRPSGSS